MKKLIVAALVLMVASACAFGDSSVWQKKTVLGSYVTVYDKTYANRSENLRLATAALNAVVLAPGEELSFNEALGERTVERGYKEDLVIENGKLTGGVGGGICQVSTTLFNAALLSGLEIVTRKSHSKRVGYVPMGRDAMVYWGEQDFVIRNNTPCCISISAGIFNGICRVSVCGSASCLKSCRIEVEQQDEYRASLRRIIEADGKEYTDYTSDSYYFNDEPAE